MRDARWSADSDKEIKDPNGTPKGKEILVSEPKILQVVNNRIYFYAEIDRANILELNKALAMLEDELLHRQRIYSTEKPEPIWLHISSYGGSIFSGIAGMDHILATKKELPVYTVVDGCCASAATFLSVVGTKRYINPNAFMMIHQLWSFMWGKYTEFQDEMKNLDKLMEMIRGIYERYTQVPEGKIEEILKHDLWFDIEMCKKYGLVDEVVE